jgi:hypothetical protein
MAFRKILGALIPKRYHPYWKLRRLIETATNGVVLSGPFQGLSLPPQAGFSVYYPKILGTYELELHAIVNEIISKDFATIINIGAAEGYYACGFAAAMPSIQVTAFEAMVTERYLLQRTIDKNGLSGRVIVKGFCDPDELDICLRAAKGRVLVVSDAEGYEYELLDPARVTQLGRAAILVEVHDFAMDGLSELLKHRFSKSHTIREVRPRPRRREDFPIKSAGIRWIPARYFNSFTSDNRPQDNFWLWMLPSQTHSLTVGGQRS